MFGLRVPLSRTLASPDFDGVSAILYNSGLREPSHWLSKVNKKGEIFQLELETFTSSDAKTDKDCNCSCSDCATDDTGYGTDPDVYSSLKQNDRVWKSKLSDFDDIDHVLEGSCFELLTKNVKASEKKDINTIEENIDTLFQSVSVGKDKSDTVDGIDLNIPFDVGECFAKEEFLIDSLLDIEIPNMDQGTHRKTRKHKKEEYLDYTTIKETTSIKNYECKVKNGNAVKDLVEVTLELHPLSNTQNDMTTVHLCEQILGIVPGHYGSSHSTSSSHRRKDRRVKVRGLVPTGAAAKVSEIKVGDCLLSVNGQEISWDNFDSVLHVLMHQWQAKLVIRRNPREKPGSLPVKKKNVSSASRLVQLVTGSNGSAVSLDGLTQGEWEPFYGAMYLSLEGVNSENMQAKEDIVYQFPRVDNKVISSRGMFITLAGTLHDATLSTVQSTTLMVDNNPVHIVYHCEGQNLFVISAPETRFSLQYLTCLVKDLVRLLQVTHGSVHDAFTTSANHGQLDCFFALLHQNEVSRATNSDTVKHEKCSLSQSAKVLPLPNEIKSCADRVLTEFEAADFGDMSDSYYGCRRSYSILGSCLFYRDYLITNHLPKDDLVDFSTYLKYHSILNLSTDQSLGQLVVWREVHPTRHCECVPEEQQFGYTEPLIARWFWLIVGYKNLIMCVSLETGGCTKVVEGVSPPDPFLIDQARAVLMQLYGQNVAALCQNCVSDPPAPLVTTPEIFIQHQQQGHDLLSRSLKKLPHREGSLFSVANGVAENQGSLRRLINKRKDSVESDNSSESSGESMFKFSKKGRLYPESTDLLQNICESREDIGPINSNRKLTVGIDNCLFNFQYCDNLEGVLISSEKENPGRCQLNDEIFACFQKSCQKIKQGFDNARKVKEQSKDRKLHVCGLNDDFATVREEGVMFTCQPPGQDKKACPQCYWVVGRCLSRSMRREVYVCFHEATPQTVIELAFKIAMGYLPL